MLTGSVISAAGNLFPAEIKTGQILPQPVGIIGLFLLLTGNSKQCAPASESVCERRQTAITVSSC